MCTCDISHLQVTDNTNALTLSTSVNEQLYLCTSLSTTPVWPLPAASITGVRATFRKQSKRQDQVCKQRNAGKTDVHITSAHKFIELSAERQDQFGLIHAVYTKSILLMNLSQFHPCLNTSIPCHLPSHNPPLALLLFARHFHVWPHTLVRALGSNWYSSMAILTTSVWPNWAAMCSMVKLRLFVLWSRDSILGTRYWIVLTWPPAAAMWRAFCPSYMRETPNNCAHDGQYSSRHEQRILTHGQCAKWEGQSMWRNYFGLQIQQIYTYTYIHICICIYNMPYI